MSDFRRVRRGKAPLNKEWFRTVLELTQPKEGYEPDFNWNPQPFVGKRRREKLGKRKDRILRKLAKVIDDKYISKDAKL